MMNSVYWQMIAGGRHQPTKNIGDQTKCATAWRKLLKNSAAWGSVRQCHTVFIPEMLSLSQIPEKGFSTTTRLLISHLFHLNRISLEIVSDRGHWSTV